MKSVYLLIQIAENGAKMYIIKIVLQIFYI